jgi:uncharacterized protein (TIGR02118 family)
MIIAVSVMRRRPDISVEHFRRHWIHPHGTMTAELPGILHYKLGRLDDSPLTNDFARELAIDGFAILSFRTLEDRTKAYTSPRIRECNKDSEHFVGAVRRLVTECPDSTPQHGSAKSVKVYLLKVGEGGKDEAWLDAVSKAVASMPNVEGSALHHIRSQAGPPESRIATLELDVAGFAEIWFDGEPNPDVLKAALSSAGVDYATTAVWRGDDHRMV